MYRYAKTSLAFSYAVTMDFSEIATHACILSWDFLWNFTEYAYVCNGCQKATEKTPMGVYGYRDNFGWIWRPRSRDTIHRLHYTL